MIYFLYFSQQKGFAQKNNVGACLINQIKLEVLNFTFGRKYISIISFFQWSLMLHMYWRSFCEYELEAKKTKEPNSFSHRKVLLTLRTASQVWKVGRGGRNKQLTQAMLLAEPSSKSGTCLLPIGAGHRRKDMAPDPALWRLKRRETDCFHPILREAAKCTCFFLTNQTMQFCIIYPSPRHTPVTTEKKESVQKKKAKERKMRYCYGFHFSMIRGIFISI